MESLVKKKNINQDGNAGLQEQKDTKIAGAIFKRMIPSNSYSKSKAMSDLQDLE